MKYSLGIDTSNYKTSIAIVDCNGNVVYEKSEYLDVPLGERGLRQSTAFFNHSNRLPLFIDEALNITDKNTISSIGVSSYPRRVEGSYMPCFLAGLNAAKTLSSALDIPLLEFSHQEGHTAAITGDKFDNSILLFHLSGGTTEFHKCTKNDIAYDMSCIGGTKDISFGQLIDRIGVSLGYGFPAGMHLDKVAMNHLPDNRLFSDIKSCEGTFNLSGIETKLLRMIEDESADNNVIVSTLFYKISKLLYKQAVDLSIKYNINQVYMAGGVSSSEYIRTQISRFKSEDDANQVNTHKFEIIFGEPNLCGDNAIGIALLANRNI